MQRSRAGEILEQAPSVLFQYTIFAMTRVPDNIFIDFALLFLLILFHVLTLLRLSAELTDARAFEDGSESCAKTSVRTR